MPQVNKIDSNITGLYYAKEASIGVVSSPVWYPLEPNGYSDFGGEYTNVARNPINPSRQRRKGVLTDLSASGGFGTDLTQSNMQDLLQGFFFAAVRKKNELAVATVDGTNDEFEPASGGDAYVAGDLLFAKSFTSAANNGLHLVEGTPVAAAIGVTSDLVAGTSQSGIISRVGYQFDTGDITVDVSGDFPALVSGSRSFIELGLIPGEWVFIGGDLTAEQPINLVNTGFARVREATATHLYFDKTSSTMVTDAGTAKTVRLFFGRVLKNESLPANIVRSSYQLERQLGAPDSAEPSEIQSEYIVGAVPNEFTLNIPSSDKLTADLTFVGINAERRTGETGIKAGTRATLVSESAFNSSTDFSRIKLSVHTDDNAAPVPLFAYAEEITLTINNGIEPDKAVGILGAFDLHAGDFVINGSMTVYFGNVTAIDAIANNSNVTFDTHIVKSNQGISIDIPLITLGDGKLNIEKDQSVKLPISMEAASGSTIDSDLDHTMLMVFWDYLPDLADV